MKRLTHTRFPVSFDYDLNDVSKIKFIFTQGARRLMFVYPSETAVRDGDTNTILLTWDGTQTAMFDADEVVRMDTMIYLSESKDNPPTNVCEFYMEPSEFRESEVLLND